MAKFNGTVVDYHTGSMFLGDRQAKKLANNTYVHMWGTGSAYGIEISVTLHGHTIAQYFTDDCMELSHCGYPTNTTRQRLSNLNRHWHFVQRDYEQYLQHKQTHELVPFKGIVEIDSHGNITENITIEEARLTP